MKKFKYLKFYMRLYIFAHFFFYNSVYADVYLDFTNTLLSTADILNAQENQARERYIVLNGVPITTHIYHVNLNHKVAIEKVSSEILKNHNKKVQNSSNRITPPVAIQNENWSIVYNISLNDTGIEDSNINSIKQKNNYITLAKKVVDNKSMMFDLTFRNVKDMKDLLFSMQEDVGCNEKLAINRYPYSRRKFCLTELTNERVVSQIVIFEGIGNPASRLSHYENELKLLNYDLDLVDKQSSRNSILFASSKLSNTTVFTYKSNNKTLDVIQSQF